LRRRQSHDLLDAQRGRQCEALDERKLGAGRLVEAPLGNIGIFRMNHLHPPFNDVRARRAVLMALSQEDYMRAIVGNDDSLWKPMPSYFTPGAQLYTEEGGEILKGPRNFDAAKRLLAESGYVGQPVKCLVAQDTPILKA
jgi:peptide/nickel transport system substrate-binding protein